MLTSSDRISSWTPLKPQQSNPDPNPNPLANQLRWNQKKKNCIYRIVDFEDPADHRVKIKENEKIEKYLDLAKELRKRVTVIPIVNDALGTIPKGRVGRVGNRQTDRDHQLRRVLETWEDLLSLRVLWKTTS